jgi:glucan biosynthesis protein C
MIHAKSGELAESVPASPAEVTQPAVAPVAAKSPRFFHLDALRAALMFWGILVHTSTLDSSNRVFRAFAEVSGLVRMEAFFVISGFLAYMLLKKYGAKVTVRKRLLAIGLPFLTALLLLNPFTNHLIHTYHNGPVSFVDYLAGKGGAGAAGPMNWHLHLWFLLALFIYSLLAPVIERVVDGGLAASRFEILAPEPAFFAMCAAVSAACLCSRIGFELVQPALPAEMHYVVRSIGNFLPFYALGMLLFASPRLRGIFSTIHPVQAVSSCALLFVVTKWGGEDPSRIQEAVILGAQTYVAMTLSSLLFWIAGKWVRGANETVRHLSDSAYSVYLFHFLSIYLFAHLLRGVVPGSMPLLTLVAVATFATTLCLHRFVIRRLPLLEFLLNGKPLRRTK